MKARNERRPTDSTPARVARAKTALRALRAVEPTSRPRGFLRPGLNLRPLPPAR